MRRIFLHKRIFPARALACLVLLCAIPSLAATQIIRWKGGANESWSNKANWFPARIPSQNETALLNGDAKHGCVLDMDDTVGSIKFTRNFRDPFSFNGHRLCVSGALADFRTAGPLHSPEKSTLDFIGPAHHMLIPPDRVSFNFSVIVHSGTGNLSISQNKFFVDTLKQLGGKLVCANQQIHTIRGALIVKAGSIDLGLSTLEITGSTIDLTGLDSLRAAGGSIFLAESEQQKLAINTARTADIPRLKQASSSVSVVASTRYNVSNFGPDVRDTVTVDTLEISRGSFFVPADQNNNPVVHVNTVISPLPVRVIHINDTLLLHDSNGIVDIPDSLISSGSYVILAADTGHGQSGPLSAITPAMENILLAKVALVQPADAAAAIQVANLQTAAKKQSSANDTGSLIGQTVVVPDALASPKQDSAIISDTASSERSGGCVGVIESRSKSADPDSGSPVILLSALSGNRSVSLRWSRYAKPSFVKYRISIDTGTTPFWSVDSFEKAADTVCTITGLVNGKTYSFSIGAVDSVYSRVLISNVLNAAPDTSPLLIKPVAMDFGPVQTGYKKDSTISFTNTGHDSLRIVIISNGAFSFSANSFVLLPHRTITDTAHFKPRIPARDSGIILVRFDSLLVPDTIRLSGSGKQIRALARPDTLHLSSVAPGRTVCATVMRTNARTDTQSVSAFIVDRAFADTGKSDFTVGYVKRLAPGDSMADTIRFTPSRYGRDTAMLIIKSDTSGIADTIMLIGECAERTRAVTASSAPPDFFFNATVLPDQTVQFRFGLPVFCRVRLEICNAIGQALELPVYGLKDAEIHFVEWNVSGLSRGVFFCRFKAMDAVSGSLKFSKTTRLIF
jgi:hypothetical protein